jgi:uncharacterized membrane protein (UPF0182 family)
MNIKIDKRIQWFGRVAFISVLILQLLTLLQFSQSLLVMAGWPELASVGWVNQAF